MKAYYDLHIHSTLSACGSDLQTPNNILNMCMLKGLNIISITDHNTLKHLPTFSKIANSYDFLFLYGVEVTVKEGFHVLAYFEKLDEALLFDTIIEEANTRLPYFEKDNRQYICDEYDNEIKEITYKLNVPISLTLEAMIKEVHKLNGLIVLAHIDRSSGILEYYQDFSLFNVDAVEVKNVNNLHNLLLQYQYLKKYTILHSSDAHSLEIINDCKYYLNLDSLTFESFKKALKNE